jgi:putative SOS response-associated peptidase YedK
MSVCSCREATTLDSRHESLTRFVQQSLWRAYKGNYGGGDLREMITSSMVTTTPNDLVKDTHPDRMPMISASDWSRFSSVPDPFETI